MSKLKFDPKPKRITYCKRTSSTSNWTYCFHK